MCLSVCLSLGLSVCLSVCLCLCLCVYLCVRVCVCPGPPWVSRPVEERQTAWVGRSVRLACPVEGDPPPLVLWVKDGRNVNPGWSRYRVLELGLRIREVEEGDAGSFVCRVTNGFGSVAVNYSLVVLGGDLLHTHG